jgi:hypothetical protein
MSSDGRSRRYAAKHPKFATTVGYRRSEMFGLKWMEEWEVVLVVLALLPGG